MAISTWRVDFGLPKNDLVDFGGESTAGASELSIMASASLGRALRSDIGGLLSVVKQMAERPRRIRGEVVMPVWLLCRFECRQRRP